MNPADIKPLILVDGSSYLFRAYHALPPLTNSKGQPTGAIYGVLNMLRKLLKDYQPTHIAVIFDSKSKNFRHKLYSAYKANRMAMPDDLQIQIQPLFAAIRALGLPLIVVEGVEADDVIGSFAAQAQQQNHRVLISTGDKDLTQLVNSEVTLINTMSNLVLDEQGVKEKFGVTPAQMVDYLSLVGDSSDNIPGVPKVGPKTATIWLNKYDSLERIIEHSAEIIGKVGENLRNHVSQVLLGRELVTVMTDVKLPYTPDQLTLNEPDYETLNQLFTELEFKNWLAELAELKPKPHVSTQYVTILNQEMFQSWLKKLNDSPVIAFNTEANHIDAMRAQLVGISFSVQSGEAAYLPLAHDYVGAPKQLPRDEVLKQLAAILNDPHKTIVGQNLKNVIKLLVRCQVKISAKIFDNLLASYVLNSNTSRHDLDTLAASYLSYRTTTLAEVAGKGSKQLTFNQVPLDQAAFYAAERADMSLRLYYILAEKIAADPGLNAVFNDIELPLMPILAKMECGGVLIDVTKLHQQSQILEKNIQSLQQDVYTIASEEFNLSSSKQLQQILFSKLKLPVLKKTPTGQPSTAEDVLQELALTYPIPKLILTYRSLAKLKSTYTDSLPEQVNPQTGRVHTSYQQAVTATGRLSSTDPNLQNIPIRSEEGRKIRQAFIAEPGFKILAADYSQVELRIMAHLSKDPGLLYAFTHDLDVHRATAAEVFGIPLEDVTAEQRRRAKAINFGLMYGMSSYGLGQQLGIHREEAQQYIDSYFIHYPKIHEYMEYARAVAAKQGYVQTLYGRRVIVADIHSPQQQRRLAAERQAINAPLQGTAADIIKLAMICIDQWLTHSGIQAHMIMQVHDELVFEIAESALEIAREEIRRCMETVIKLAVPLKIDIGVGNNWDEAH